MKSKAICVWGSLSSSSSSSIGIYLWLRPSSRFRSDDLNYSSSSKGKTTIEAEDSQRKKQLIKSCLLSFMRDK